MYEGVKRGFNKTGKCTYAAVSYQAPFEPSLMDRYLENKR